MRLLHFDSSGQLTSTDFSQKTIQPYAILSHTWGEDEFIFDDLANGTGKSKAGYGKIRFCGEQAARDHVQYFWVDTCCINKWDLPELSNAINSMFLWYKNAARCYVFLSDVSTPIADAQRHQSTWEIAFQRSRWVARGWTLQELLAPASIVFFSSERQQLGDKDSLKQQIHKITRILVEALRGDSLSEFSIPERMAWMAGRQTTQEEDMAYSLIGIFGVTMEFRYGEGKERAQERLQEVIVKANTAPFVLPYDQNARFVGRESQLAELKGRLFVGAATAKVAITGPGGIGKTHLALELAYRIRRERKTCSVLWISASDNESFYQGYAHIARQLDIPGWDNEKTNVRRLVQLYLSNESAGPSLLVLENVEAAKLESNGSSNADNLIEYLPSSEQGAIVFTTMDMEVAAKLAPGNIVELPEMEQGMARRMLEMCLVDPKSEPKDVDVLLQGLAYLPLAIVQAAAYINVNKISLQTYLPLLAEKKKGLVGVPHRDFENVIAATWLISFEEILHHDPLAADYLLFMACVDRNDIPLALLPTAETREQEVHAVQTLGVYSLVTKRTAESALDLHRLVHFSTRSWLKKEGLMSQQTQAAITRLLEVFPDHNHKNRSKRRRLLPHATFALLSSPARQENEAKTKLVWKCAMTLYSDGRWKESEELFVQVMETRKKKLGADHASTLTSMANLASTYQNQGRWNAAEELEVQVIETSKKKLGADHPDTLASMANLASTYRNQGRWDAAKELFIQVIETSKKKLGADHPSTLTSMNNLAFTWHGQRRDADAICLIRECAQLFQRILGSHHPNSKATLATLTQWEAEQVASDKVIQTQQVT